MAGFHKYLLYDHKTWMTLGVCGGLGVNPGQHLASVLELFGELHVAFRLACFGGFRVQKGCIIWGIFGGLA